MVNVDDWLTAALGAGATVASSTRRPRSCGQLKYSMTTAGTHSSPERRSGRISPMCRRACGFATNRRVHSDGVVPLSPGKRHSV